MNRGSHEMKHMPSSPWCRPRLSLIVRDLLRLDADIITPFGLAYGTIGVTQDIQAALLARTTSWAGSSTDFGGEWPSLIRRISRSTAAIPISS